MLGEYDPLIPMQYRRKSEARMEQANACSLFGEGRRQREARDEQAFPDRGSRTSSSLGLFVPFIEIGKVQSLQLEVKRKNKDLNMNLLQSQLIFNS